MDLMKIATDLFMKKMGASAGGLSEGMVGKALGGLLGGSDGQIDIGSIMSKLDGGGLAGMASSWLGDGANDAMDASAVTKMFGDSAVSDFAGQLNLDPSSATDGLSKMIPDLIDQSSSGGKLLESITGGSGGLLGMASKLFK